MLLKFAGSLVVLCASTFLGYAVASDFGKRPQQLRELQAMMILLENEIAFMSNLLKDALHKVGTSSKGRTAVFFRQAVTHLEESCAGASEAWSKSVEENIENTALNQEDREILITFGKMLGSSDYEGQIRNIRIALSQLQVQEKKAEELKKKNESLYRNLGILGGLAIVIVLL